MALRYRQRPKFHLISTIFGRDDLLKTRRRPIGDLPRPLAPLPRHHFPPLSPAYPSHTLHNLAKSFWKKFDAGKQLLIAKPKFSRKRQFQNVFLSRNLASIPPRKSPHDIFRHHFFRVNGLCTLGPHSFSPHSVRQTFQ